MAKTYYEGDSAFDSIIKARKRAIYLVETGQAISPRDIWTGIYGKRPMLVGGCIRRKNGWVYRSVESGIEYKLNKDGTLGRRL